MVASNDSVREVVTILRRHVPNDRQRIAILRDLLKVNGNRSFTDTIRAIALEDFDRAVLGEED